MKKIKCPICDNVLNLEDKKYMVFCEKCKTNLWTPDLLTKDPKLCGITW